MKYNQHILAVTKESVIRATHGKKAALFGDLKSKKLPFETNDVIVGPRDILETDENYMQIIPYIVVERDGKILSYTRTKEGGEQRLHNKVSVGFGGHIDVGDLCVDGNDRINLEFTIANAALRELSEEIEPSNGMIRYENIKMKFFGIITDMSNAVGRVHVGIALMVSVNCDIKSKESQISINGFKNCSEILREKNLEGWSKIVLEWGHFK